MATIKFRSQQMLCSVYPLNDSYTKYALTGLENSYVGLTDYEPVVRIVGIDFQGYPLKVESWKALKEKFDEIDEFFRRAGDEQIDERFSIPGYKIKFRKSYYEKAIEFVLEGARDEDEATGEPSPKRAKKNHGSYVPPIVLKRVTFDRLKEVSPCIDYKLEYLSRIKKHFDVVFNVIVDFIQEKLQSGQSSQFQYFSLSNIKYALYDPDGELTDILNKTVTDKNIDLSKEELYIIFNEIKLFYKPDIVWILNERINK